jgi:HEPN domain-containing protein
MTRANNLTPERLNELSNERIADAEKLLEAGQYQSVVYLSGYAIETAFKARICRHLNWPYYKLDHKFFKTHDLKTLLDFTGKQNEILRTSAWSYIYNTLNWVVEMRYEDPASFDERKATQTLESAKILVGML